MQVLQFQDEIAAAQQQFVSIVRAESSETVPARIGFQSGNTAADVLWLRRFGIWAFFGEPPLEKSPSERYWSVFGVGEPQGMLSIACEINSPKNGINRRIAGAYARDAEGHIYVLHRGILNAHGRVPKNLVREHFGANWGWVTDGELNSEMIIIGALGSAEFLNSLQDFVLEVARFKEVARSQHSPR